MNISMSQWLVLSARCNAKYNIAAVEQSDKKEIGKGGIQSEIDDLLKSLAPDCYYISFRADVPHTTRRGVSDFIGWYRGKPFAMEVKRPGQKTRVEQNGELMWAKMAGGNSVVVHSRAEAETFLKNL